MSVYVTDFAGGLAAVWFCIFTYTYIWIHTHRACMKLWPGMLPVIFGSRYCIHMYGSTLYMYVCICIYIYIYTHIVV